MYYIWIFNKTSNTPKPIEESFNFEEYMYLLPENVYIFFFILVLTVFDFLFIPRRVFILLFFIPVFFSFYLS